MSEKKENSKNLSRREFLKYTGVTGLVGTSILSGLGSVKSFAQSNAGGTLNVITDSVIDSLNMITTSWMPTAANWIYGVWVTRDYDFNYQPGMVKSWDISDGGRTWTLKLQEGMKFHDGEPLTADVFEWWIPILKEGSTGYDWEAVKEWKALDKHTIEIKMSEPYPYFLRTLNSAYSSPVSPKAWEKWGKDKYGYDRIVGAGPYKIAERPNDDKIVLERFEDFDWGAPWWDNQGPGYLQNVVLEYIKETATRMARLETGEADVVWSGLPPIKYEQYQQRDDINVIKAASNLVHYMGFDQRDELLKDRKVRLAIAHAINREPIHNTVYRKTGEPAHQFLRKFIPASDIPEEYKYYYNPDKAKKLMKEAGWKDVGTGKVAKKDGVKFEIVTMIPDQTKLKQVATVVRDQLLNEIGVQLNIESYDTQTFNAKEKEGTFNAEIMYYGYDHPSIFHWFFHSDMRPQPNSWGVNDPKVDRLDKEARTAASPEELQEIYKELNIYLQKDIVPTAAIYFPGSLEAIRERVKGWKTLTLGGSPICNLKV